MHSEDRVLAAEQRSLRTYISATQFDGVLSLINAGAMTVAQQDEIRARTYAELRERGGPLRLTSVFSGLPIHAVPTL